ncbi:MAG: TlpA family protein disulfide reductase [Muribaculaceae bacterium]
MIFHNCHKLVVILFSFLPILSFGVILPIENPCFPQYGIRFLAAPVKFDSINQSAEYKELTTNINVLVNRKNDSLIYSVSYSNELLLRCSYPADSVLSWKKTGNYESYAEKFIFNGCDYFVLPGTKLQYNDSIYNEFPVMILKTNYKENNCFAPGVELLVFSDSDYPILKVMENGCLHGDRILNGNIYKESYDISDTLTIRDKFYKLSAIDADNNFMELEEVTSPAYRAKIPDSVMSVFHPYFIGKEYLFIDFWGTWCSSCIKSFPELKRLYEIYGEKAGFFSICYDSLQNWGKAKDLFSSNKIPWPMILDEIGANESIVKLLVINNFPTFLIVDKDGYIHQLFYGESEIPSLFRAMNAIE